MFAEMVLNQKHLIKSWIDCDLLESVKKQKTKQQ